LVSPNAQIASRKRRHSLQKLRMTHLATNGLAQPYRATTYCPRCMFSRVTALAIFGLLRTTNHLLVSCQKRSSHHKMKWPAFVDITRDSGHADLVLAHCPTQHLPYHYRSHQTGAPTPPMEQAKCDQNNRQNLSSSPVSHAQYCTKQLYHEMKIEQKKRPYLRKDTSIWYGRHCKKHPPALFS
jgi:hypothetical protein